MEKVRWENERAKERKRERLRGESALDRARMVKRAGENSERSWKKLQRREKKREEKTREQRKASS